MTDEEKKRERELDQRDRRQARRQEWEKIKSLGWKARVQYFWDYYKFVLVIIFVAVLVISIVRNMIIGAVTNDLLNVSVLNPDVVGSDTAQLEEDFIVASGGVGKNEEISFDSTISIVPDGTTQMDTTGYMKLFVYAAAGSIDVVLAPESIIDFVQEKGMLIEMEDLLGGERIAEYEADGALYRDTVPPEEDGSLGTEASQTEEMAAAEESLISSESGAAAGETELEGSAAADTPSEDGMASEAAQEEETYIYGIRIDQYGVIGNYDLYSDEPVYLGVIGNTNHEDYVLKFIDFMSGKEISDDE